MSSRPKKLTNPLRPVARYRKGKGPAAPASDSDSDDDNAAPPAGGSSDEDEKPNISAPPPRTGKAAGAGGKLNIALKEVEVDDKGMVTVGGRGEVGRTEKEMESEEESSEEESSEEDEPKPKAAYKMPTMPGAGSNDGSSEYETDSEDEPAKPIYKPVFVFKRNRDTIAERDRELDPDALEEQRLSELETRKQESHDLVAESILRELAEKEVEQVFPDVDDTDGLEPQAEFQAWSLRELTRIKRDREAHYAREKEREEVEARRALPEALRMKEDMERAQKTRDEKPKGNQVFLQKYHHKGAFYTDSEVLKKHDYTAPTVSTLTSVESLPAVMQKRNFGKAHQTKYTHLAAEDTSKGDSAWGKKPGFGGAPGKDAVGGGCFTCGGPHLKRDCPQTNGGGPGGAAPGLSGSNGLGAGTSRDAGWGSRPPPRAGESDSSNRYASSSSAPPRGGDRERDDGGRRAPNDRDRLNYDDTMDKRGDWERGGDLQRERYAAADRDRDHERYGGRDRDRDSRDDRDSRRWEGGDRRRRSRSRSRSPPRNDRDRPKERDRDDKRRRVE